MDFYSAAKLLNILATLHNKLVIDYCYDLQLEYADIYMFIKVTLVLLCLYQDTEPEAATWNSALELFFNKISFFLTGRQSKNMEVEINYTHIYVLYTLKKG